jgi:alkanesulfonate monooxygenase
VRPILGPTEALAWERAHRILATTQENIANGRGLGSVMKRFRPEGPPPNAGSQRLLAAAEAGELHDRCLWTPLAAATGAPGNTTALVGTPETVAEALLDYVDIGVTTLLIRGYDPYEDAVDYGRDLIPLVRDEVTRRESNRDAAAGHTLTQTH